MTDPTTITTATDAFSPLIGQAVVGLLSIPVIWAMLRQLRSDHASLKTDIAAGMATMNDKLTTLQLEVAADSTKHDVRHLKEAHAEIKKILDEMRITTSQTERELGAVWSKIGDRPADKQRGGR